MVGLSSIAEIESLLANHDLVRLSQFVKGYIDSTYRAATSPTSKALARTAFAAILLISGAAVLSGLAFVAYVFFYNSYLPDQITTVPVHLQYGYQPNPYGTADLRGRNLKELQEYDVTVHLILPRSPVNLERGNFMVELSLMGKAFANFPPRPLSLEDFMETRPLLAASYRPAVLPYTDPTTFKMSRLLFLAYHLLYPAQSETVSLAVPVMERVSFSTASALPASFLLEIRAGQTLQTYGVEVTFVARLSGLRWFMYHHWVSAAVLFTGLFWVCEVVFMVLAYAAASAAVGLLLTTANPEDEAGRIKLENQGTGTRPKETGQPRKLEDIPPYTGKDTGSTQENTQQEEETPGEEGGDEANEFDDEDVAGTGPSGHGTTGYSSSGVEGSMLRRRASDREIRGS